MVSFRGEVVSLPEARRHRQARIVLRGQRSIGLNAEALEHGDDLARVLCRVPGAALEQVVKRLQAVIGLDVSATGFVRQGIPPPLNARGYAASIGADILVGLNGGRRRGVVDRGEVFDAV